MAAASTIRYNAGQVITADDLNNRLPIYVQKTGTQSATASTTLTDDTDLFVDLLAGRVYEVVLKLAAGGPTAGDIKLAWRSTGTISPLNRLCFGPSISTSDVTGTAAASTTVGPGRNSTHGFATAVSYGLDGSATSAIEERFIVTVTVAGRVQLQWAQNVSNATASQVFASSHIIATPIA